MRKNSKLKNFSINSSLISRDLLLEQGNRGLYTLLPETFSVPGVLCPTLDFWTIFSSYVSQKLPQKLFENFSRRFSVKFPKNSFPIPTNKTNLFCKGNNKNPEEHIINEEKSRWKDCLRNKFLCHFCFMVKTSCLNMHVERVKI